MFDTSNLLVLKGYFQYLRHKNGSDAAHTSFSQSMTTLKSFFLNFLQAAILIFDGKHTFPERKTMAFKIITLLGSKRTVVRRKE